MEVAKEKRWKESSQFITDNTCLLFYLLFTVWTYILSLIFVISLTTDNTCLLFHLLFILWIVYSLTYFGDQSLYW
jgi:hypothetical protein